MKKLGLAVGMDLDGLRADIQDATGEFRKFSGSVTKQLEGIGAGVDVTAFASVATAAKEGVEMVMALAQAVRDYARAYADLANLGRATGMDSAALGGASALAGLFEMDSRTVAESANVLAKEFGISFQQALDQITVLGSSTIDLSEGLEQVREYSTQMRTAGYTAEEFIGLMQRASARGVWSDKAPDALKEGLLSVREQTKATTDAINALGLDSEKMYADIAKGALSPKQALDQIVLAMLELPPTAQPVGQALADIFRGAGEDLGVQNFDILISKTAELSDEQKRALAINREALEVGTQFEQVMLSWLGSSGQAFTQMGTEMKRWFLDSLPGIEELLSDMATILDEQLGAVVTIGKALASVVAPIVRVIWNIVSWTLKAVSGIAATLLDVLAFDWEGAAQSASAAWAGMTQDMQDISDTIRGIQQEASKPITASVVATASSSPIPAAGAAGKAGVESGKEFAQKFAEAMKREGSISDALDEEVDLSFLDPAKFGQAVDPLKQQIDDFVAEQRSVLEDGLFPEDIFAGVAEEVRALQQQMIEGIASSIQGLTAALDALLGGWQEMREGGMSTEQMFQMVAQGAAVAISMLQALAAANIIASESAKGLIGIFTAGAALAGLVGLFAKYAKPKKTDIPRFANGGLVYGPTTALVGEYPGARNNPEVIAPLSSLKKIIGAAGHSGKLEVEIGFSKLAAASEKMKKRASI